MVVYCKLFHMIALFVCSCSFQVINEVSFYGVSAVLALWLGDSLYLSTYLYRLRCQIVLLNWMEQQYLSRGETYSAYVRFSICAGWMFVNDAKAYSLKNPIAPLIELVTGSRST